MDQNRQGYIKFVKQVLGQNKVRESFLYLPIDVAIGSFVPAVK